MCEKRVIVVATVRLSWCVGKNWMCVSDPGDAKNIVGCRRVGFFQFPGDGARWTATMPLRSKLGCALGMCFCSAFDEPHLKSLLWERSLVQLFPRDALHEVLQPSSSFVMRSTNFHCKDTTTRCLGFSLVDRHLPKHGWNLVQVVEVKGSSIPVQSGTTLRTAAPRRARIGQTCLLAQALVSNDVCHLASLIGQAARCELRVVAACAACTVQIKVIPEESITESTTKLQDGRGSSDPRTSDTTSHETRQELGCDTSTQLWLERSVTDVPCFLLAPLLY